VHSEISLNFQRYNLTISISKITNHNPSTAPLLHITAFDGHSEINDFTVQEICITVTSTFCL